MEDLKVNRTKILAMYKVANPEKKKEMEEMFGEETFVIPPVPKWCKTIEEKKQRYEELKKQFEKYESLSKVEKQHLIDTRQKGKYYDPIATGEYVRSTINGNWVPAYVANHSDCGTISYYSYSDEQIREMTFYILPDCKFGCGSAPCCCEHYWAEYQNLKKELGL